MSTLQHIEQISGERAQSESMPEIKAARIKAFENFRELGFPTTKNEEWKYTSLNELNKIDWKSDVTSNNDIESFIQSVTAKGVKATRLVFVNGRYAEAFSSIEQEDKQVVITNLSKASGRELFIKHFNKYASPENASLNSLNTAGFTDGVYVEVPNDTVVKYPISIIHVNDGKVNTFSQPRHLIIAGKGSKVTLIESHYTTDGTTSFTNIVNEVYADENSNVEYYKIQREQGVSYQNNFTSIFQEGGTKINHITLTLDGKWIRNNLHFYMNGRLCNSTLYGLYLTDKDQHVDNHTRVDHASPDCFSDEKYKGVLKDHSTAVFNGKIVVHPDAQKTNAYQRNQNIILSNDATVNTKPQLEIFADDVKCTHGATIGQLDEEPLFYLRSRGIPEDVARKLLLTAFAEDISEKITIPEMVALMEAQIEAKI